MAQGGNKFAGKKKQHAGQVRKGGRAAVAPRKRAAQQQHVIQKKLVSAVHKRIEKESISKCGGSLSLLRK